MRYATVRDLSRNPASVLDSKEPVVITKNGKPTKLVIAFDEDMAILNQTRVKAAIRKSRRAKEHGSRGKSADEMIAVIRSRARRA